MVSVWWSCGRLSGKEIRRHRGSPLLEFVEAEGSGAHGRAVVDEVAVGPVLDLVAERIAPVVEDLAALDVAADAPRMLVAARLQVLAALDDVVEINDLVRAVVEA